MSTVTPRITRRSRARPGHAMLNRRNVVGLMVSPFLAMPANAITLRNSLPTTYSELAGDALKWSRGMRGDGNFAGGAVTQLDLVNAIVTWDMSEIEVGVAELQLIGALNGNDRTFSWAHEIEYTPEDITSWVRKAYRFAKAHQISKLLHPNATDPNQAWELTSIMGWISGAFGVIEDPTNEGSGFYLAHGPVWIERKAGR